MNRIFVNDKPIILTTEVLKEQGFKNYLLETVNIGKVIKELNTTSVKEIRLIGKDEAQLVSEFLKKLPNVIAGGGKVTNDKNEILFIFRNGKWDLPKGKTERKESIEETAMREVEEETGVKDLKLVKLIETTYHIFKRNGKYKIKVTHWFEMSTSYSGKLTPQENEGITRVEWLDPKDTKSALINSYANIRSLI